MKSDVIYLVAITKIKPFSEIKEFIDIALVASSYDLSTVLYLDKALVAEINEKNPTSIKTALDMLTEFSVPIYSNGTESVLGVELKKISLFDLELTTKHSFIF